MYYPGPFPCNSTASQRSYSVFRSFVSNIWRDLNKYVDTKDKATYCTLGYGKEALMVFTEDESGCSKRASQNKCKSQSTNPHSLGIKNVDHYTLRILHNAGLSIWRDLSDWTVYMKQLIKGQDYVLPYLSPRRRGEAPCEGTNSPRLFTPGETKALAKSKVHQWSRAWLTIDVSVGGHPYWSQNMWRTVMNNEHWLVQFKVCIITTAWRQRNSKHFLIWWLINFL
jgi:hypothetical protein